MDGQWFRMIALDWYDRPVPPGRLERVSVLPAVPGGRRSADEVGMPSTVALAGLSWLASLLAFAAIHRLAAVHAGPAPATWTLWFVALSPGALSLVLGYSDAFFLAALAWALVVRRPGALGGGRCSPRWRPPAGRTAGSPPSP